MNAKKRGFLYFLKFIKFILSGIVALLCGLSALLSFSVCWMFRTWSNLTMEELVYHLEAPLEGTNEEMIVGYINQCAVPAVLILIAAAVLFIGVRKSYKKYWAVVCVCLIAAVASAWYFLHYTWTNLDVKGYMDNSSTYSTFIDDNYVDPRNVEITFPERKRNLIYIFLESMEMTYMDAESGGGFEKNFIPELTELAKENEDFSGPDKVAGGHTMPGATWTAGAIVAHTSGLPLKIDIEGNSMDTQDSFFPGEVTLGDILEKEGYSQTFLCGSDATFGGRRLYFTQHGNYDIIDYNYAIENGWIPEDYRVWWGYEDQKLFEFARKKLLELASQEEPFNLTMLTVDTHFEDGYVCNLCDDTFGDNRYGNVISCSSRQLKEFVDWIRQQDFYENTTVVLVGDHLTMDSDFCEDMVVDCGRRVYTCFINSAIQRENDFQRNYTTYDMFPTTIASLGATIEGDRLGLGANLFSPQQTIVERVGLGMAVRETSKKSKFMEELADIDLNSEKLQEREREKKQATVIAGDYDAETGYMPVAVGNLENAELDAAIQTVQIAVWSAEDQGDLQWIQMQQNEDGSYGAGVYIPHYQNPSGELYIHVYVIDENGGQTKVGETVTTLHTAGQ